MERYINTIRQGLAASGLKISSGLERAEGLLWDYLEGHIAPLDFQDFANDYYVCLLANNIGKIEEDGEMYSGWIQKWIIELWPNYIGVLLKGIGVLPNGV